MSIGQARRAVVKPHSLRGAKGNTPPETAVGLVSAEAGLARDELTLLLEEQAALRRVPTLVAQQPSPEELFAAVAEAAGLVVGADLVAVVVYSDAAAGTVVASWSREGPLPVGTVVPLDGDSAVGRVFQTCAPARIDGYGDRTGAVPDIARTFAGRSTVGAPVVVGGAVWGALAAAVQGDTPLPDDAEARLAAFTELVATAIGDARAHDELRRFGEEQAALARVATLVAAGADPDEVFTTVIVEASRLVGLPHIDLTRYEGTTGVIIAASGDHAFPVGSRWDLDGPSVMGTIARTGRPTRIDDYRDLAGEIARVALGAGFESAIGAPITIEGRLWGAIIALSTDPEPISEQSEWRLNRFTDLVSTAVANAESQSKLAASRRRIVTAGDEARRRIERNLHDGAQQRLVALRLDVERLRAAGTEDAASTRAGLLQVGQDLETILEDLRELSHGLHPPMLSRLGLGPSLEALARRLPIPVRLEVDLPKRPSPSLETAVYYTVSETLTNAIKHSHASEILVTITIGEKLQASIVDDGVGDADANGSGITGLRDRVEALGGRFALDSPHGGGTSISIELPADQTIAS